ncbi:MucBP domain-containing protein [Anaerotruncus colihominis]|uniref:MucBP domain-containing protein n=3 Tax=Anaerotruncus colihominis TaxID=169435 RepID=UPI00210ACD7B|nr:MucBP domain-containing protein [Anaerotruncus colihominis]MCQ4735439.1 MucBP domain-containing protein [Anaerotruncus colihominis]
MKKWKRFLASVCAAVCAAGFSLPAFAADLSPTWFDIAVKAMPYVDGSDGEYLFSPPDEIFNDNSRPVWQQIKEDFNDDSRVVLFGFDLSENGKNITISVHSYDKATLNYKKNAVTVKPGTVSTSHTFKSASARIITFSYAVETENWSLFQHSSDSISFWALVTGYSSYPHQPFIWSNQSVTQLPSDVAFASDIKNIVFEAPPTPAKHTLTIQYQYEDSSQAAEPVVKTYEAGAAYQVVSPVIGGFYTDQAIVSGTMPDKDLTITVTYLPVPGELLYTLSVVYQFSDGTAASDIVIKHLEAGTPYSIVSPVITGYTADKPTVSGTMPENDLRIVVTYSKDSGTEGGGGIPGEFPDMGGHIEWHDPFAWFDMGANIEFHNPFAWG